MDKLAIQFNNSLANMKQVTLAENKKGRPMKASSWLLIYDLFNNDREKTNQYWNHLFNEAEPVHPLYFMTGKTPPKDLYNWSKEGGADTYFQKVSLLRHSLMLLHRNNQARLTAMDNWKKWENTNEQTTDTKKIAKTESDQKLQSEYTKLTNSILVLFEITHPSFFGTDAEREEFDDKNDAHEVFIAFANALKDVVGETTATKFCHFHIKTTRNCTTCPYKVETRLSDSHIALYPVSTDLDFGDLSSKEQSLLFPKNNEVTIKTIYERKYYRNYLCSTCGDENCNSDKVVTKDSLETYPEMLWFQLHRTVSRETFINEAVKPIKMLELGKNTYRLRSIICWMNDSEEKFDNIQLAHYYVFISIPIEQNEWLWLKISDHRITVVKQDVISLDVAIRDATCLVYEKTKDKQGAMNAFDTTRTTAGAMKYRSLNNKRNLKKDLTSSTELTNPANLCFFNTVFQAISFMDFSDLHGTLNINDDLLDEDHLVSHISKIKEEYEPSTTKPKSTKRTKNATKPKSTTKPTRCSNRLKKKMD